MRDVDLKRILELFKDTDPLLKRWIISNAKRYESLDSMILDYFDLRSERIRKQKRLDEYS